MPDPFVFGPDARHSAELEAAASLARGDQLGALEAEAYVADRDAIARSRGGIGRILAGLYLLATGRPMRCPACRAPYHAHRGRACQW